MTKCSKFTCDGCGTTKDIADCAGHAVVPSGWHRVELSIKGQPTHICADGARWYHLCGGCGGRIAHWFNAGGWKMPETTELLTKD